MQVSPPTVRVPVLEDGSVLGTTEKLTGPSPFPLLLEVITIQDAFETAVQVQEEGVDTLTTPVPPAPPKERVIGAIE